MLFHQLRVFSVRVDVGSEFTTFLLVVERKCTANDVTIPLEVVHAIRVVSRHDEYVHLLEKTCRPSSVGVHLAQERHSALVGSRLIAMNRCL